MKYELEFTGVSVPMKDVGELHAMIDNALMITFGTFARHCNWRAVAQQLGYQVGPGKDLHMRDDYAIRFYRSKWKGKRCYYIRWSAIEYVFLLPGE